MEDTQDLTTIVESNHIDLAIAGWLDAHSRSAKTLKAYVDTINQFRGELLRIGHDLDSDVRTPAMVAQRYASFTRNPHKNRPVRVHEICAWLSSPHFTNMLSPVTSMHQWTIKGMLRTRSRSCHVRRSNHTRDSLA